MRGRPDPGWVCVAAVATAHGVRGALRLRTFTERPDDVAAYGPVFDAAGRELFTLEIVGHAKDGVIVEAAGIRDRDAALALRGTELWVPRACLPATDDDEYYVSDLEGLNVVDRAGVPLGVVHAVNNFGAGDLLEIETAGGERLILPFDRATVPTIDLDTRRLVVVPPSTVDVDLPPSGEAA